MMNMSTEIMRGVAAYYENKLQFYVNKMGAEGSYLNNHNGEDDHADGVVILADGNVCPVTSRIGCCLNPLYVEGGQVQLSCTSVAGNVNARRTLVASVDAYNEELLELGERMPSYLNHLIVGYHSFKQGW